MEESADARWPRGACPGGRRIWGAPDGEELDVAGVALGEVDVAALAGGNQGRLLLGVLDEEIDELPTVRENEPILAPDDIPARRGRKTPGGVRSGRMPADLRPLGSALFGEEGSLGAVEAIDATQEPVQRSHGRLWQDIDCHVVIIRSTL